MDTSPTVWGALHPDVPYPGRRSGSQHGLPAMYDLREFGDAGGLMTYG